MQVIDDDARRRIAARVMEVFPQWLVMWGPHSRLFWAYPLFDAPAGTNLWAADANILAGIMRRPQRPVPDEARDGLRR